MKVRIFKDESGRTWIVRRIGSTLSLEGPREEGQKYSDIARSCAYALKVTDIAGVPLAYINEHRRIWSHIWKLGEKPEGS